MDFAEIETPEAVRLWNNHARDLVRAANAFYEARATFSALGHVDLSIRSRKLQWQAEKVLAELAAGADAVMPARRLP